jgi:hypothetical protein
MSRHLSTCSLCAGRLGIPRIQRYYRLVLVVDPTANALGSNSQASQESGLDGLVWRWSPCHRLRHPAMCSHHHGKDQHGIGLPY